MSKRKDDVISTSTVPGLGSYTLYVGIDVGKQHHVAGFVSNTLLAQYRHYEACPFIKFEQSRAGFHYLIDRIQSYAPLEQCAVVLEQTGHYHKPLVQYLLEQGIHIYMMHVQSWPAGLQKTDKQDALGLAVQLYNQVEKGVQVREKTQMARRVFPPTDIGAFLKGLVRHRYELIQDCTRRKNKLIAICDELFPEFTQHFKDPNLPGALALRLRFPTPAAVAAASLDELRAVRIGVHPGDAKLARLQAAAHQSIGTRDPARQHSLVLEQRLLIGELQVAQTHLDELERMIRDRVEQSREGQILMSIPGIGPIQAAVLIAVIGNIDNFTRAAALKSYLGWAPCDSQTGITRDHSRLTYGGNRMTRQIMFLIVGRAIRLDCEWADLYNRLVPKKGIYDARTRKYKGTKKVIGRIAGQMITMIYALLKQDREVLSNTPADQLPPTPILYDRAIHQAHRNGQYRRLAPKQQPVLLTLVPEV